MKSIKLLTENPVSIERPRTQSMPLVLSCPHSGQNYPLDFIKASALEPLRLRSSEDSFVNEIFQQAKHLGAPLIHALFPRVFVDVNRGPFELDPTMFKTRLPDYVTTKNNRISAGLGTIAKSVAHGELIYKRKLDFGEVKKRIDLFYKPYHRALQRLVQDTKNQFGYCILLDCHSMPSSAARSTFPRPHGNKRLDIVLGDCHGSSCHPSVVAIVMESLLKANLTVRRNNPYAGGFITSHYGKPYENVHSLQIEINRSLYMDEAKIERLDNIASLTGIMSQLIANIGELPNPLAQFEGAAE